MSLDTQGKSTKHKSVKVQLGVSYPDIIVSATGDEFAMLAEGIIFGCGSP